MRILFMGDIVLSENKYQASLFSDAFKELMRSHDVVCCNFEAPLKGERPAVKVGPVLRNHAANMKKLVRDGVNLFALANNHIFDYGTEGLRHTLSELSNFEGLQMLGAGLAPEDVYRPVIYKSEDLKIGVINVAENGFGASIEEGEEGYAYMLHPRTFRNIRELRECCDRLILICHGGAELWDVPLPEYRDLYHRYIEEGVSLVIAHHPHVPQGWENYKNGRIYYSLGNTAFDKGSGPSHPAAMAVSADLEKDGFFCEEVYTVFKDGLIDINDSAKDIAHIRECVNLLHDEGKYNLLVNEKCLESYEEMKYAYRRLVSDYHGSPREWAKRVIKKYVMRETFQDRWLYHNVVIETHLWMTQRAVRLHFLKENQGKS